MFETTCTLFEIDPKTESWVSKGTGIIHVNIDKNLEHTAARNSRLSMSIYLAKLIVSYETAGDDESHVEYSHV